MSIPDHICRDVCAVIRQRLGLELGGVREIDLKRWVSRIRDAFPTTRPETLARHIAVLDVTRPEWARLVDLLTVGETYFFRDTSWFEAIERHVLQPLIDRRRREGRLNLRLWSAGCATGEEPYSLAMLLDRLLPDRLAWSITILASDINTLALDSAKRGVYRAWSFRQVPVSIIERHFDEAGDGFRELDPAIRGMVAFAPHNLVDESAYADDFADMDVIVCRNVVMYFSGEAQRLVAGKLGGSLAADGWLLTSSAEAWPDLFQPLAAVHLPALTAFKRASVGAEPGSAPQTPASPKPRRPIARSVPSEPRPATVRREDPIALARALADRGDYLGASLLCERGLARAVLDYEGHFLHAQICQELGDREGARKALRRSLYLKPESIPAHFLLGNLLESDGERDAARRSMRNVVDLAQAVREGDDGDVRRLAEAAEAFLAAKRGVA